MTEGGFDMATTGNPNKGRRPQTGRGRGDGEGRGRGRGEGRGRGGGRGGDRGGDRVNDARPRTGVMRTNEQGEKVFDADKKE